MTEKLPNSTGQ